jgi:signal peptidase I
MRRWAAGALVALAAWLVLAGSGCGGATPDAQDAIRKAVTRYHAALAAGRFAAACRFVTPSYWHAIRTYIRVQLHDNGACGRVLGTQYPPPRFVTVSGISVRGSRATATLRADGMREPLQLADNGDRGWLIDCCIGAQLEAQPIMSYRVADNAMLPTFRKGEIVTSDNRAFRYFPPSLGDVVVFHPPRVLDNLFSCPDRSEGLGKPKACDAAWRRASPLLDMGRIVGLDGDILELSHGFVIRGFRRLAEPYARGCKVPSWCDFPVPNSIPAYTYFVLGDNRGAAAADSRFWGPIRRSWIVGLVRRH